MGNRNSDDHEFFVLNFAEDAVIADAVIADAVAPEARKVIAESLTECARIGGGSDPRFEIVEDFALDGMIEFS